MTRRSGFCWLTALLLACPGLALAAPAPAECKAALAAPIPARPAGAPEGSQFVAQVANLGDDLREAAIREQVLAGNIPAFLRRLEPVTLDGRLSDGHRVSVTVCVAPDYLAVGSDGDFLLTPMRLDTALEIAGRFGFVLPTPKMVDAIYAQARVQLQPQPLPAGDAMRSTAYYAHHNQLVHLQRVAFAEPLGALTAGDKKDLVVTGRLWSNLQRVAIYGWHQPNGRPIQPLSTVHGARYADYSHGVRLVANTAYLDGAPHPLLELLQDPRFAGLFSSEGVIPRLSALLGRLADSRLAAALQLPAVPN